MALRLHPVGQGPMQPYVNKYNNAYEGNVDETAWEVNTDDFLNEFKENQKRGYIESENYPLNQRRNVSGSNRRKTPSPKSTETYTPYTIRNNTNNNNSLKNLANLENLALRLSNTNNNNSLKNLANLENLELQLSNTSTNSNSKTRRTRRRRNARKTRKNRKLRRK